MPSDGAVVPSTRDLDELASAAASCTACPLFRDTTQTVFGKGSRRAPIFLVGEQPGDVEDKKGSTVRRARRGRVVVLPRGRRHHPEVALRDECREALQARGPRQAPVAQAARSGGDRGVPSLVGRRDRRRAAQGHRGPRCRGGARPPRPHRRHRGEPREAVRRQRDSGVRDLSPVGGAARRRAGEGGPRRAHRGPRRRPPRRRGRGR